MKFVYTIVLGMMCVAAQTTETLPGQTEKKISSTSVGNENKVVILKGIGDKDVRKSIPLDKECSRGGTLEVSFDYSKENIVCKDASYIWNQLGVFVTGNHPDGKFQTLSSSPLGVGSAPEEKVSFRVVLPAGMNKLTLIFSLRKCEGKAEIRQALSSLTAYGSTSGSAGLELAYEQAEAYKAENGNNRVIILSDGDFNVGISDTDELTEFIQDKAKSGIALSVIGVGLGNTRDDLLQTLALNGNGNYAYIDTQLEAEKVFTEELSSTLYTVANDAKAGVSFNPDKLSSYRLLGYDMKRMSEDDFNNSEKDAGEIGSNLCVTVLYELAMNMAGEEEGSPLAEVAIRYKDADKADQEVKLTVNGDEGESEDTMFASCVAEFALVLRQSRYATSASLANVLNRLADLESYLGKDKYKEEFREIAALAEKSGHYVSSSSH